MKKSFLVLLVVVLISGSLLGLSCADKGITKTITVTNVVPATISGVITRTAQPPTVITPTFDKPAPEIPHVYLIEEMGNPYVSGVISPSTGMAICFECHGVPPQHDAWRYDTFVCLDCHVVSDNPVLNP